MNELAVIDESRELHTHSETEQDEFVTFKIDGQLFGVQVLNVQDILKPQDIAFVPLAPPEVKGSINLRGRIVTVIDVRVRLGLPPLEDDTTSMGVTVELNHELYTLMVDQIGEVLRLPVDDRENVPSTLNAQWKTFADGIFKLDDHLMVVLDIERLLSKAS